MEQNNMNCGGSTSTATNAYIQNCPHKLPCGLCRLTMMQCPKNGWTYTTSTAEGIS